MEAMEMEGRYATALWPEGATPKRPAQDVIPCVKQGCSSAAQGAALRHRAVLYRPSLGGCL